MVGMRCCVNASTSCQWQNPVAMAGTRNGRLTLRGTTYDASLQVSESQLCVRLEDVNNNQAWAGTFAASCEHPTLPSCSASNL